jgi:general secretion pathway protein M
MITQLSRRERIVLAAGGIVVIAAILFLGVVAPYQNALALLDTKIEARQRQVKDVQHLRHEYLLLQRQLAEAEKKLAKGENFSLFSFVEAITAQAATKENLVYMRPQPVSVQEDFKEESVEIKLERIRLDQLVRLLYEIDAANAYLQVKNLRIKTRFDDQSQLNAVLTISSYGRSA